MNKIKTQLESILKKLKAKAVSNVYLRMKQDFTKSRSNYGQNYTITNRTVFFSLIQYFINTYYFI